MTTPLDLTLLRSFVAVIDCGSIQLAAARVGRSQSAVSMQIKRLEDDVGRPLFQREGRSLRPNPAGQDLLLHARRLLRLSDEAMASLRQPEASGVVRVGVPEDYAARLLTPTLARFGQDFPLAELEVTFQSSPAASLSRRCRPPTAAIGWSPRPTACRVWSLWRRRGLLSSALSNPACRPALSA